MNLIDQRFEELKLKQQSAFIPFISIGDPDIQTSVEIIRELEAAGADIIELGVPYSDPMADGPVIQRSSERALKNKITIVDCIQAASMAREQQVKVPFVLFTYFNPILQLGVEKFFALLNEHDISGVIIPDLPIEEDADIRKIANDHHIHLVPLVAPTSHERIKKIAERAQGFIYCVSSLGVTGTRSEFLTDVDDFIKTVKESTDLPVVVGFGISSNEQVKRFSQIADGVVVGSAIVKTIESLGELLQSKETKKQGLLQFGGFVGQLINGGN